MRKIKGEDLRGANSGERLYEIHIVIVDCLRVWDMNDCRPMDQKKGVPLETPLYLEALAI